jgi:hypothetical protein
LTVSETRNPPPAVMKDDRPRRFTCHRRCSFDKKLFSIPEECFDLDAPKGALLHFR